jgi:hypothetical protein
VAVRTTGATDTCAERPLLIKAERQAPVTSSLVDQTAGRPARCTPVLVFGCHGGAGATTLATQLGLAHEAGRISPQTLAAAGGRAVVVVTRGTAVGSRLAVDAVAALRNAGAARVVVAVVADGPWPEPLAARARLRALAGHAPVIRIPYITRWRFEDTPSEVPARYERALGRLRAAYCTCADRPVVQATA